MPGGLGRRLTRTSRSRPRQLGLIRTARWFVARTQDFDGWTLFFVTQFDGNLPKYFDDFVLNGKENLLKAWGQCEGCPDGPDATAADVVEFIARGQIKTLACYDFVPELSNSQIFKAQDWYQKAQKFQRARRQGRRQPRGQGRRLPQGAGRAVPEPCPAPRSSIPTWRTSGSTRTSPSTCRADRRGRFTAHTRLTRTGRLWRPVDS